MFHNNNFNSIQRAFIFGFFTLFSINAYAYDTSLSVYPSSSIVKSGQQFTISLSLSNDSSGGTAFSAQARLSDLSGFTIKSVSSLPSSSCFFNNSQNYAYCSKSLAEGESFTTTVTLEPIAAPGQYTLQASSTPVGTDSTNNSETVTVSINDTPIVNVVSPLDESQYTNGASITLSANASDVLDGDLSSQITWWSNISGLLGTGSLLTVSPESGRHTVSAYVVDSAGTKGTESVQINMGPLDPALQTIKSIAGSDVSGYSGDNGLAKNATFNGIVAITRTPQGEIYIVDSGNSAIRKIDTNGVVTTLFSGQLYQNITSMTHDDIGNVYFYNANSASIKMIDTLGVITSFAGGGLVTPQEGLDSPNASLTNLSDFVISPQGELFLSMKYKHQIFRVGSDGIMHVVAGNGVNSLYPVYNQPATEQPISYPSHIAVDSIGNLYISQNGLFDRVLKVDTTGILSLYAGSTETGFDGDFGPANQALLNYPADLLITQNDELVILDRSNYRLRIVDNQGIIKTLYGTGIDTQTGDGGFAAEAGLGALSNVEVNNLGELLLSNTSRLREISTNILSVDLSVSAQDNTVIQQGGNALVSFVINNNGDSAVQNVFLDLQASNNLVVNGSASEVCSPASTDIRCIVQTLNSNASTTFDVLLPATIPGANTVSANVSSYFNELTIFDNDVVFQYTVNAQPILQATSPTSGASFLDSDVIQFTATASDAEDGVLDNQITWVSNIDGQIGQGNNVSASLSIGTHVITVSVNDNNGGQAQQQISVVVNLLNIAPEVSILSPVNSSTINEDNNPIVFSVSANDTHDGDISSQVVLQSSIDGVITSPAALSVGNHTITASVTDSGGLTSTDTINLTITPHVNVAPQVTVPAPVDNSIFDEFLGAITFSAAASDLEDGDLTPQITLQSSIDGIISSPAILSIGSHVITATVTDSGGLTSTDTINVTVIAHVNEAPQLTINAPANNSSFDEFTGPITFNVSASDLEDGDLTSQVTLQSSIDGVITSPAILSVGTHVITASVTDSNGLSDSKSINVTVFAHINVAPVITFMSPANNSVFNINDGPITFNISATDLEDGNLSSQVTLQSSIDGVITSPTSLSVGTHVMTASVTDNNGAMSNASINVIVEQQVNTLPQLTVITPTQNQSFTEGQLVTLSGSAFDTEDGNLSASISWSSNINGVLGTGSQLNIFNLSVGTHTITAQVIDSSSAVVTSTVNITITLAVPSYCTASGITASYEWLESVEFGGVKKVSGQNGGYSDFSSEPAITLTQGTNSVVLTPGFSGSTYNEFWGIWIDFNEDAQFTPDEQVFNGSSSTIISSSLNIPLGISGLKRMRVVMKYGSSALPCGSYSYGEVEDYTVNIVTTAPPPPPSPAYCSSSGNDSGWEWINSVSVAGFTFTSGNNGGYFDYTTDTPFNVIPGLNSVTLSPGFSSGSYTENWQVWIDFNHDNSFTPDEKVYSGISSATINAQVSVPALAIKGPTRMRVSMSYGSPAAECGTFQYGEVEDYTVIIN